MAAVRIVTGLTLLASRDSLYFEIVWEPLADRRRTKIRSIMYIIHYNMVPEYLQIIMPKNQYMLPDNLKIITFPKVDLIFISLLLSPKTQMTGMLFL